MGRGRSLWISIHPPRGGWDGGVFLETPCSHRFQSTHPVGGGTCSWPPTGADAANFNPPTPWGVGPLSRFYTDAAGRFQSTHPVGGGTLYLYHRGAAEPISIHPPRGGWDGRWRIRWTRISISIHPPRGGWDECRPSQRLRRDPFQSTHPVGGGTRGIGDGFFKMAYFNPPTPWGVGPRSWRPSTTGKYFNPPTPWGVGLSANSRKSLLANFNPPTPWGVGPLAVPGSVNPAQFQSTHPVGGGTRNSTDERIDIKHFTPPTPWGVGLDNYTTGADGVKFQSTHPVGGGTQEAGYLLEDIQFQSTHPVGGGTSPGFFMPLRGGISIHPPRGGWDRRNRPV